MLIETNEIQGMLVKKKVEYVPDPVLGNKAVKVHKKENLSVREEDGEFDADTVSINYFSSIISLANAKFNKALYDGASATDAYKAVYVDTVIPWKLKDNTVTTISVEKLVVVLENAMNGVAGIVGADEA